MSLFHKAVNFLKKNANVDFPIYVRRIDLKDDDGNCSFDKKKKCFIVRINKNLTIEHSIDVALHEIAHAMSWEIDKDMHGPSWGLAHAKLYRKFLEHFINK